MDINLPKIARTVFNNVESDVTLGTATKLATKAVGISGEDIATYVLPYTTKPPYDVIPDEKKTAEMINTIYSIEPKNVTEAAINE